MSAGMARRCPNRKCRSWRIVFTEIWSRGIRFEQGQDGRLYTYWGCKEDGAPERVQARCEDCSRRWTVPGAQQIIELGETVECNGGAPGFHSDRGPR